MNRRAVIYSRVSTLNGQTVDNQLKVLREVAEKKVISNTATVGLYYWKKGSDFVKYAKKMIFIHDSMFIKEKINYSKVNTLYSLFSFDKSNQNKNYM